jgi:Spy/CpxP family protein refolding chaperone
MKLLVVASMVIMTAASAGAQGAPQRQGRQGRATPPAVLDEPGVAPAEIQRMFDAYALVQAQDQLQIGDEQYARFLVRYKALQELRRRLQQEQSRRLADLRRMLNGRQADESQLRTRMQELQEAAARGSEEARKAYDAIDEVLDVRQRAGFRVFEDQMERRKLELITRARQANRPKPQP